ncbi:MAG: hypothetical protein ABIP95_01755 [Pelobium sp.]
MMIFSGCFSADKKNDRRKIYFYDLQTYFTKTAEKLNQENPTITKSVAKNKITEKHTLKVTNWNTELALFIESDINKGAWRDSYSKDSTATKIIYTAIDNNLKTRKIEIWMDEGKPKKFTVYTKVDNMLYHTTEELEFIPDSSYSIKKHQKILILGLNDYEIKGLF